MNQVERIMREQEERIKIQNDAIEVLKQSLLVQHNEIEAMRRKQFAIQNYKENKMPYMDDVLFAHVDNSSEDIPGMAVDESKRVLFNVKGLNTMTEYVSNYEQRYEELWLAAKEDGFLTNEKRPTLTPYGNQYLQDIS